MAGQGKLEAIAAGIIQSSPESAEEALSAIVEALNAHHLGCLDIVPLAEQVERGTGLKIIHRVEN